MIDDRHAVRAQCVHEGSPWHTSEFGSLADADTLKSNLLNDPEQSQLVPNFNRVLRAATGRGPGQVNANRQSFGR